MPTNDDIVTWATSAAVILSIFALVFESRRSRLSLRVDVLLKFEERFIDEPMRIARSRAASGIRSANFDPVDNVIDFFEMVGMMLKRKAIDRKMAWHAFYTWVEGYAQAGKVYIEASRADDPTVWCEFTYLHQQLQKEERKNRGLPRKHDLALSAKEIADFLEAEIAAT